MSDEAIREKLASWYWDSDNPLVYALQHVLNLCSENLAYEDPRTLKWYIKRGIAEKLGLDPDEVEF